MTTNVHVCMIIDAWYPFVGGGQIHVKNLINQLKRLGVKVTLFHSPHHHLIIRALWLFWVVPQVLLYQAKNPFSLIHAHAFAPGLPAKLLSVMLNIPVVYTVHGSHLMDVAAPGLKTQLERFLLTKIRYSHQISVNKSFTKYPNVNKNVTIIGNGVDIKEFNKIREKKRKKFTLLYVGRKHQTKGLGFLQKAVAEVKKQYPNILLVVITDGKITRKNLVKEFKRAHTFILPSLAEGQPLVLLEAWAAKLPVIATATPGVREIAQDKYNALLVPPGNTQALVVAIKEMITLSPRQRAILGARGYSLVTKQFTWEKTTQKTLAVYQQVVRS